MLLLKELLFILATASYSLGSEVELNLSRTSVDSFDVVKFETGPALTTRITPKDGIYVKKVLDTFDSVWTPLSQDFTLKSFEIHQRSGHNDLGHLVVSEPSQFLDEFEDSYKDNLNSTARTVLRNLSNLFFTKKDNVWYPLTQYHFDILKDDMSSSESTLDLYNFTDSNVMVTYYNSVTKYYLLARRLSHIVRVNCKGEMLWVASNKELFKSAYLSYNKQNELVLVKMTLTIPNLTYDPLDTKSTRYYFDSTVFFSKMDGSSWKKVANDEYENYLQLLFKNYQEDASKSAKVTLDLSYKLVNPLELHTSHFNNKGIEVTVYKAVQGHKLNLVKDNLHLLWTSDNPETNCQDAYLYNIGNNSLVLDLRIGPKNPSYKFFKKENGTWVSLSLDDYKHHLHTSDISLPVDLDNVDYEFLSKIAYKLDGVPVTELRVPKGYYFHQVNHKDTTLWDGTRFQRCTKVFQYNSAGYEFLSLLVYDPLTGKSHSVYYERKGKGWTEISEAFFSSLFFTVQLKLSFEFNLEEYLMNNFFLNDLNGLSEKLNKNNDSTDNLEKSEKYFTRSVYQFRGVPMLAITPKFDYNLAKVTEGSEVIWTRSKGYNTISLSFNAAPQPTFLRVSCSDNENPLFQSYFVRRDGKWAEVLYEDYYKLLNNLANVQNDKYFTFNIKNIVPSNKYILDVEHDSVTMAKITCNNGYFLNKFVDGTETLWQDTDNKNGKGHEEFFGARILPYKDPKFVVLTSITKDFDMLFNYFIKDESDPNNPKWLKLDYDKFYPKMDEFILEREKMEEVVDLADVYKGLKRDYYTLQDSKIFTLENFGLLTFKERVENLSLYVRGIRLYKFRNSDLVKEVVFVPSNFPRCIRITFVNRGNEQKKYFVKDSMGYKPCEESEYMAEFFKYSNKKHNVHLDLKYYFDLVFEFNNSHASDESSETLTSFVSSKLEEKYPVQRQLTDPESNEFAWGVYNYYNLDIVELELNPRHILNKITDGDANITTCQYSEYVKVYFTLTQDNHMILYHKTYDSNELKQLNFRSLAGNWSMVMGGHTSNMDVLLNFASKPVSLDLFHLTVPNSRNRDSSSSSSENTYNLTTYEVFNYNINTQITKPGYILKQLYYNSHLLYDSSNGFAKQYNFKNSLETVVEVDFYPKIRPRLIHMSTRSNNLLFHRYYKIESTTRPTDGSKPATTVKSLNVFDYYNMLAEFGKVDEFSLDVSVSSSTDDYRLVTELVYNSKYLLVTPQEDKYMVLLTQGDNVIWEADNERVTKVLLFPKHEPVLALIYYTNNRDDKEVDSKELSVKRFKFFESVNKWLQVSEDYALDIMKMSKEKLTPFNLNLDTLSSRKITEGSNSYYLGNFYFFQRKNLYGLLFTVVKPTHNYDIVKVKDKGQVLFNIFDTLDSSTDEENSFESVTGSGNRILNVLFGPDKNYKLLRVTYLKNFTVMDTYFRKNDADSWEEVTSTEFGKALWLVKRFSLVPVVLNVDDPRPHLFTTVADSASKNNELTRILPNDKYHITRVVCNVPDKSKGTDKNNTTEQEQNESSEHDKNNSTDKTKQENHNSFEHETKFLFGSDDVSVLYAETTKYEPRLLRLYYTKNSDFLQVNKEHFAFRDREFRRISQSEFDKLLSLFRTLSNLVTYNLDPFYRTYFHTNLTLPKYFTRRYKEVRESVFKESVNMVYPREGYDLDKLMFKDKTLWKSGVDEEGLLLVTYPPKQPVRAMVKFKNSLNKTIGVQYFDYDSTITPSGDVVGWVKGFRAENEHFDYDKKFNNFHFELSDKRVLEYADKFTYVNEGVYTSVVMPKAGSKITKIFDGQQTIWAAAVNNDAFDKMLQREGEEVLTKFYYAPSNHPKVLAVEYKDFDGIVRLRDFKKVNSKWVETSSEFVSLYNKMLETSYTLDLNKPLDKEKVTPSSFMSKGFKVTTVVPYLDTNIVNVVVSEADNSGFPDTKETKYVVKELWKSSFNKKCFVVQFAPEVNPKVVLLSHSNALSFMDSKFFYKDPVNGWTEVDKPNYGMFIAKLLELENSFEYNLKDKPRVPTENFHYEITDLFGVKFAAISPRHKKKLVGVNDHWRHMYEKKEDEELLDLLVSPPENPKFATILLKDPQGNFNEKYFIKNTIWTQVDYEIFLKLLNDENASNQSPDKANKSVSLNELHEKVLNKLSKHDSSENLEISEELNSFNPFTLDLNNVVADKEPKEDTYKSESNTAGQEKFSKKTYVESTIERTVLKFKGDNLLAELRQGEEVVWKLEGLVEFKGSQESEPEDSSDSEKSSDDQSASDLFDNKSSPKSPKLPKTPTYKFNEDTLVVTHMYFAPSDDPKVITLFFKESKAGPRSLRFVKDQGMWIKDATTDKDLTNEDSLLSLTDNKVLDIEKESIRYGNELLYKKVIVSDNLTYFMDIEARDGTPNKIVKVVDGDSLVWDKREGEEFVSARVYPLFKPKFAKLTLQVGDKLEHKYFRKYKLSWFSMLEKGYENALNRYFKHLSTDFESVNLSRPHKYSKDTVKYASFYRTLHKVHFRSLFPINDYKMSDVHFTVGGNDEEDDDYSESTEDGDESELKNKVNPPVEKTVIFEATSNEQIKMVSYAPADNPKFLAIFYNSTATLVQPNLQPYFNGSKTSIEWTPSNTLASDYTYFSGVPSSIFDKHDQEIKGPFYPSTETNFYYKDGDKWLLTSDATFKQLCLKYADELLKRTTPFDVDLDNLSINDEKFTLSTVDISGAFFTKLTANEGYSLSHVYQYNKVVYMEGKFPIVDLCFFPRVNPKFLKVSHQMSETLINNYYFVSYQNIGLLQRDYMTFKSDLFDYLNHKEDPKHPDRLKQLNTQFEDAEDQSETTGDEKDTDKSEQDMEDADSYESFTRELLKSNADLPGEASTRKLVLYGHTDKTLVTKNDYGSTVTVTSGNQFLYYVDFERNTTSAYSYNYDTNSVEFKDAFKTFSGNMYKLNYYMVVPTSTFVTKKLFDSATLLFDAEDGHKVVALAMVPKRNPRCLMVHYLSESGYKYYQMYYFQDDKWSQLNHSLLRYKLKNVMDYHLSAVFPDYLFQESKPLSDKVEEVVEDAVREGVNEYSRDFEKSELTEPEQNKEDPEKKESEKSESDDSEELPGRLVRPLNKPFYIQRQHNKFFKVPYRTTDDKYLLHGHFEHPEVTDKFEFSYDTLKNTVLTSVDLLSNKSNKYMSTNFKFYFEEEDTYKLVLVDEPNYKLNKLTFNGKVVFDTEDVFSYTNRGEGFTYDLSVLNVNVPASEYHLEENKFEDHTYTLVKVSEGSRLKNVVDGNQLVWESSDKAVKRFVYYPPENPNKFFISYLDENKTEEKYEYLLKHEGKWVRFDEANKLDLASTHPFFSSKNLEKPVRLVKGVLLTPPYNPNKLHVLYTENNMDKYTSFLKVSNGKSENWMNVKLAMSESVSMRIKFVTATLRSNSVVFTGTHPQGKDINTGMMTYTVSKLIHDSLSTYKWFFVYNPEKGRSVYFPIGNFKITKVSFGKHDLFKYDFHSKEITSVYMTTDMADLPGENTSFRVENVTKVTVLVTDLDNKGRRFTWKRTEDNKWVRTHLTTDEVDKLFKHVNEGKELSPGASARTSTFDKTFVNFIDYTDNHLAGKNFPFVPENLEKSEEKAKSTRFYLSGNVTRTTTGLRTTSFFNYYLDNNEMDVFVTSLKTKFFNLRSDENWYDYKIVVVPEGYNATMLRTRNHVLFDSRKGYVDSTSGSDSSTTGDENVINAVYMTPANKPCRVYLCMTNKYGDRTFKYFYKKVVEKDTDKSEDNTTEHNTTEQDNTEWVESSMTPSHMGLVRDRMEDALVKSVSLRLACYHHNRKVHFTGSTLQTYKGLRHFNFFVDTDSLFSNVAYKSMYTFVDEKEDYKVLVPYKDNKVSHVTFGCETLFALKSQFHTVKALLLSPAKKPTTVVVYYVDDNGSDFYETYNRRLPVSYITDSKFSTRQDGSTRVHTKYQPQEEIFHNNKDQWYYRSFLFGDTFGTIKKIYTALGHFESKFPHLAGIDVSKSSVNEGSVDKKSEAPSDRRKYNLDVYLSGVYSDSLSNKSYDFVYYYDPKRKDSLTVFDDNGTFVKEGAFSVVAKDTLHTSYLYLRPSLPQVSVKSVVSGDQELLSVDEDSTLLSLTLSPFREPRTMMLFVRDSTGQDLYYYLVKKNGRWSSPGTDLAEYLKMKLYTLAPAEELDAQLQAERRPRLHYNLELRLSGLCGEAKDPNASFVYSYDPKRKDTVTVFDGDEMYQKKGAFLVVLETKEHDYLLLKPHLPTYVVTSVVYGSEELLAVDQQSLLKYVLISPHDNPTMLSVHLTDAASETYVFFYKVNNKWLPLWGKDNVPLNYTLLNKYAHDKLNELEKPEEKLPALRKDLVSVYLSGSYYTNNSAGQQVTRSFVYYHDPKHKDTAYVFEGSNVLEKKGAFNVFVNDSEKDNYLVVVPSGPEFMVDHIFADGQQLFLLDNSSKFLSLTWSSVSNPDTMILSTEVFDSNLGVEYYDYTFKKVDGKWSKQKIESKQFAKMKQLTENALALMSTTDLKKVEPTHTFDVYLSGEHWTRDSSHNFVTRDFVWFYDQKRKDSVFVFEQDKVVRRSGAFEVYAEDKPFEGPLVLRAVTPEFQVFTVSTSKSVLLHTDMRTYFVSLTLAPLHHPTAMLVETVNSHREYVFHYFTKKDDKWSEVFGESTEKKDLMKRAEFLTLLKKKDVDDKSTETEQKETKTEPSELVKVKKPGKAKQALVTCTKFYFDMNKFKEETEHYTTKRSKYHGHDYVLVHVHKHSLLQRLTDGNLLVWNNYHGLRVTKFGFLPPEAPAHACLGLYHEGKHFYRFFFKLGGEWDEYYNYPSVPDILVHMSYEAFSEFTLDLSAYNQSGTDYLLKVVNYFNFNLAFGVVTPNSKLVKVVDEKEVVWTNDGHKQVLAFVYFPPRNPMAFGLVFVKESNAFSYKLFQKSPDGWHPFFTMDNLRREMLELLLDFNEEVSDLNKFALDLSVDNNNTDDYSLLPFNFFGEDLLLGAVSPKSNLTKVVDGFLDVWSNKSKKKVTKFAFSPPVNPTILALAFTGDKVMFSEAFSKRNGAWLPEKTMNTRKRALLEAFEQHEKKLSEQIDELDDEFDSEESTDVGDESPSEEVETILEMSKKTDQRREKPQEFILVNDVVFDIHLDLTNDFYKNRYDHELYLYSNLVFNSYVPMPHVNVTEVSDSFTPVFNKLTDEKIERVSFYPRDEPQLLMINVSMPADLFDSEPYSVTRKFTKADNKWVLSEDKFNEKLRSYLAKDPLLKSLDTDEILKSYKNQATEFDDLEVGKDTLSNSVQVLLITPKNSKKISKVMNGNQLIWAASEKNEFLKGCFLLPFEEPELISVLTTDNVTKYYHKIKGDEEWKEVDEATFYYLSSYLSGTTNKLDLSQLSEFEDSEEEVRTVNVSENNEQYSLKITKTRYDFLKTGIMKSDKLLFGVISKKSGFTHNLVEIVYRNNKIYKMADNEKLTHIFYFPFVSPKLVALTTAVNYKEDDVTKEKVLKRYFVRNTVKLNGVSWYEVDRAHFNNLLELVRFTSQYSPVTFSSTELKYVPTLTHTESTPLIDFVFDLKVHKETKEAYVVKKMSKNDQYYTVVVMNGYRMTKIFDLDLLVYEPNKEHILDLYYSLDPENTTLSVKYLTSSQTTDSKMIGFVSFTKQGNNWERVHEFKMTPTNIDYLYSKFDVKDPSSQVAKFTSATGLVERTEDPKEDTEETTEETEVVKTTTPDQDKEFVFDLSTERVSTKAFNMTRLAEIGDDYSVEVASGYKMTKVVDGEQVLFETPENALVNSLYYTPALAPVHLTARMSTVSEDNKPLFVYSYFIKKDGNWIRKRIFTVSPTEVKHKKTNKTLKVSVHLTKKSEDKKDLDDKSEETEQKETQPSDEFQDKPFKRTVDKTTLSTDLDGDEVRYTDEDGSLYPDEEVSTTSDGETTRLTLKPVVFDFSVNKESTDGFTVVSSSDYYSSVQFSRGFRLTKLLDGNEVIYEPKPFETVTSIYYTPRDTPDYLTLRSTTPKSDGSEHILYLYMHKMDGKWTVRSTTSSPDFVEVPLDDKEFELNVNNLVEDKGYTTHRSLLPYDSYSSVQVASGYKMTKLVDGDQLVYKPVENETITIVYCDPPKMPNKLTIWYTTTCEACNSFPLTSYVHLKKTDGKWEHTIPKMKHTHKFPKPLSTSNEFVLDLAKDRVSGPNFALKVETVDGVDLGTVWPRTTSRLVKVVYDTHFVWAPTTEETCTRVVFAPFNDPTAAAVVYHPTARPDANNDTVKYFVRAEDGTWNETDPDSFIRQVQRSQNLDTHDLKLNFSDAANHLMNNLGVSLASLFSCSQKQDSPSKSDVSILTYPMPKSLSVTSLYDDKQLVHKSNVEDLESLQLFANRTDMFLKATTELFDNKTTHFYRTSFVTPAELSTLLSESRSPHKNPDLPVKCAEFDFDLAVEHHCTKQFSVRHLKVLGHDSVSVTVHEHNKLAKLLDGDTLVWKQHERKYAVRFVYLPPNKPTHLCLGVYHLKDHKVKYRFLYKEEGKWKHYTSFDNVPTGLFNAPKVLEASNISYDISKSYNSTNDYVVEYDSYLDLSYTFVSLNEYSNLSFVSDGAKDVWVNDGKKSVQKFLYYPSHKPDHFLVMYHHEDNSSVAMYDYVDRKGNGWFPVDVPRHPKLFETTLKSENKRVVFPQLFEQSSVLEPGTLTVGCSKFDFDLSSDNHCTKDYSVRHRKHYGYDYVLVHVHKHSKLTKLVDGDLLVWKNNGYQFVLNFAYLPPKNPTEVYMSAYCLKAHETYKKFFYKLGGKWHEHPHKSKSYLSKLLKELDATHFDFDLSGYNQNFVHFKEFVDSKNFNLVEVDENNKLDAVFDSSTLVWKNPGTKNAVKFLYYPSENPKHLAVAFYRNDEPVKEDETPKLLFDYLNKVDGIWEHEMVPEPIAKTLEKFTSTNPEGLVPKLVRKWRKIDPTEFYNNFLHMSIVKQTTDFNINTLPDEGIYEVKEGFKFEHPVRICNPLPGTHVSNVLEENVSIWKVTEPNQHAKSIMLVYEFKQAKEFITYEPKLLQVFVKNRDRITTKYFNKTTGNSTRVWEEIDASLYINIYEYLMRSDLKNKYFEHLKKHEVVKYSKESEDEFGLDSTLPVSVGETKVTETYKSGSTEVTSTSIQVKAKSSVFRKLGRSEKKTEPEKLISFEQLKELSLLRPAELLYKVKKPEETETKTTELDSDKSDLIDLESKPTETEQKETTEETKTDLSDEFTRLPQKTFSYLNLKDKKLFNFDLNSYTILSPYYRSKKVMVMDEEHVFIALNIDSRLRYMKDDDRYLTHFPISSDCRGFSFYPRQKPTELLAVFRTPEDKKFVKHFVKVNDQWELLSDSTTSVRMSKVLINLDVHIASNELIEFKRLNQEKLAEDKEKTKESEKQPDLMVTTRYKYTDPKTKVTDTRSFEYNLSKTEKQFGLFVYEVNELEKIFIPMLGHNVVKVKLGDFVFYGDNLSEKRVVSITTVVDTENKLKTVIVTLTDNVLLTHMAYTLDSHVWVSYHLFPTESSQLSDNIQYAQNKLYSDTFTEKYFK